MKEKVFWMVAALLVLAACSKENASGSGGSESEIYYKKGYDSDRKMQHRMAEYYWKTAMATTVNSTKPEDVEVYAKSACRLTNVLSVRGEYESALEVAVPAAERLEELQCDTMSDYTNLLVYIGCCKSRFGLSADEANQSYDRAYKMHLENIEKHRTNETYKNAIAGVINIAYNCNETSNYEDALRWTKRYGELISQYEQRTDIDTDYVDKQWARYDIYQAIALEGLKRKEEAAAVFTKFQNTRYSHTPNGKILAVDYLAAADRWEEAADCYESLEDLMEEHDAGYSLEMLQKVVQKYQANIKAGRLESAKAVSMFVCERLDSAITQMRRLEAEELSTIRATEAQKAVEQARISRMKQWGGVIALAVVFALLAAYLLYRRRQRNRMNQAYARLQDAYDGLESNSRAEERSVTELEIARGMETLLKPKDLPQHDAVDMYAIAEKASEPGGDFYDVVLRDGKLIFCVGDSTGRGVGSSMTMALMTAMFRTVAATESQPDHIVSILNQTLAGVGGENVSATVFVGVLDLESGQLSYCNAEHVAPLLIGERMDQLPVDDNVSVGLYDDWTFSAQETSLTTGTLIFLYTDGLTKAENVDHEAFDERRMMGEALQSVYGLDSAPQPFIDRMSATVHRFVGETALKDDITMLAIRYGKPAKVQKIK